MKNITIYSDGAREIEYVPHLCNGTGWAVSNLNGDTGSYKWCAEPSGAKARVTFTGVAIYHIAPNEQSTQFVLNGVTLPGRGPNSASPSIFWMVTDLAYREHTLELLPLEGGSRVNIGTFLYTVPDSEGSTVAGLRPVFALASQSEVQQNIVPVIVGTIVGFLIVSIFISISFFLYRRSRERSSQYTWESPLPPLPISDKFDNQGNTGHMPPRIRSPSPTEVISVNTHRSNTHLVHKTSPTSYKGDHSIPPPPRALRPSRSHEWSDEGEYELASRHPMSLDTSLSQYGRHQDESRPTGSPPQQFVSPISSKMPRLQPNRRGDS